MQTVSVALIAVVMALLYTFALPEIVELLNDASTSPGVPASLQGGIESFVDILGFLTILVMGGLFWASLRVFMKRG